MAEKVNEGILEGELKYKKLSTKLLMTKVQNF